jgi:hypothetical protein
MIGLLVVVGGGTAHGEKCEGESKVPDTTCAKVVCDQGYRVNPETAAKISSDRDECCLPTCAAHKCAHPGNEPIPSGTLTLIPQLEPSVISGKEVEDLCCQTKWIDVTEVFKGQETHEIEGDTWKCCCSGAKCTLKAIPKEKGYLDFALKKEGCLKLAGPTYHSYISKEPKGEAEGGKCIVKEKEAADTIGWNKWEKRQANDGAWYTWEGFENWYTKRAKVMWNLAKEDI